MYVVAQPPFSGPSVLLPGVAPSQLRTGLEKPAIPKWAWGLIGLGGAGLALALGGVKLGALTLAEGKVAVAAAGVLAATGVTGAVVAKAQAAALADTRAGEAPPSPPVAPPAILPPIPDSWAIYDHINTSELHVEIKPATGKFSGIDVVSGDVGLIVQDLSPYPRGSAWEAGHDAPAFSAVLFSNLAATENVLDIKKLEVQKKMGGRNKMIFFDGSNRRRFRGKQWPANYAGKVWQVQPYYDPESALDQFAQMLEAMVGYPFRYAMCRGVRGMSQLELVQASTKRWRGPGYFVMPWVRLVFKAFGDLMPLFEGLPGALQSAVTGLGLKAVDVGTAAAQGERFTLRSAMSEIASALTPDQLTGIINGLTAYLPALGTIQNVKGGFVGDLIGVGKENMFADLEIKTALTMHLAIQRANTSMKKKNAPTRLWKMTIFRDGRQSLVRR